MFSTHSSTIKASFSKVNRRFISDNFQAGDYVIITPLKKTVTKKQWLSRPLKNLPNANVNLNFGKIPHSDLIGASPLGKVHTIETRNKLAKYICSRPTLEQWITLSQRKAQPIYSFDAQAIVALTDLHIDYPDAPTEDGGKITPLQFLEAGTGHGSLTLAISKVLHPANALAHYANDSNLRGAVLHTIDCNGSHSITGKRTLKGFRRGMYLNNVEFHVADSPSSWITTDEGKEWLERELISKKEQKLEFDSDDKDAFLSGIFLDMPNYHEEMVKLAPYVKTGGFIIVFCPSITQIVDAIDAIAEENERLSKLEIPTSLHLEHERTVQLLDGAGGGLKEWDTRRAFIRATGKIGYSVRPKVGVRTVAGGFVAVWRKLGKDVNLELERELMETYEGKPAKSEEVELNEDIEFGESEITDEVFTSPSEKAIKVESQDESKDLKVFSDEKVKNLQNDFLSTDPDVFDDAAKRSETAEPNPEEQNYTVFNKDAFINSDTVDTIKEENSEFKIEEATLIPHSVLHTVHHSCHGDPDVHVGYITDVYMLETQVQDDLLTPELQKSQDSYEETGEQINPTDPPEITEHNEPKYEDGGPKSWTKHTF
jgi:tRNA A58 N-methylase Trm61